MSKTTTHGYSTGEPASEAQNHLASLYEEEARILGDHIRNFIESNTALSISDKLATDIGLRILEEQDS